MNEIIRTHVKMGLPEVNPCGECYGEGCDECRIVEAFVAEVCDGDIQARVICAPAEKSWVYERPGVLITDFDSIEEQVGSGTLSRILQSFAEADPAFMTAMKARGLLPSGEE